MNPKNISCPLEINDHVPLFSKTSQRPSVVVEKRMESRSIVVYFTYYLQ